MSVFQALKRRLSDHATLRGIDTLVPGVAYETCEFRQQPSKWPDKEGKIPVNLIVYLKDGVHRHYSILPSIYNNLEEAMVTELNDNIKANKPPSVVYYGKDQSRNDVEILEHGEVPDVAKISAYESASPAKRQKPL